MTCSFEKDENEKKEKKLLCGKLFLYIYNMLKNFLIMLKKT